MPGVGRAFLSVDDTLVVVVDGDRERPLGVLLPDAVLVQLALYGRRLGDFELGRGALGVRRKFLVQHALADVDAVVADIDPGTGDELLHLGVGFAAEGAEREIVRASHERKL